MVHIPKIPIDVLRISPGTLEARQPLQLGREVGHAAGRAVRLGWSGGGDARYVVVMGQVYHHSVSKSYFKRIVYTNIIIVYHCSIVYSCVSL